MFYHEAQGWAPTKATRSLKFNKLAKLGDAISISNLKLSITDSPTDRGRCRRWRSCIEGDDEDEDANISVCKTHSRAN